MGWTIEQAFIEIDTIRKKIKDSISGLKSGAYAEVANNTTTLAAGYVLDARQGNGLNKKITGITCPKTFTIGTPANGYITNSSKEIVVMIPINKPISDNNNYTTAALTVTGLQIRGVAGTITADVADLTFETGIRTSGIYCKITNTDESAFTATNNTPVSVYISGSITLS